MHTAEDVRQPRIPPIGGSSLLSEVESILPILLALVGRNKPYAPGNSMVYWDKVISVFRAGRRGAPNLPAGVAGSGAVNRPPRPG